MSDFFNVFPPSALVFGAILVMAAGLAIALRSGKGKR